MNVDDETDPATDADVEAELLWRAGGGDGRAFHRLVDLHANRLFRVAMSLVGNSADAEDVLQEALVGAFRGARKFEGRSSVRTWLTRIVVTQAAKFWRSRTGSGDVSLKADAENANAGGAASGGSAAVEAKIDVHSALKKLSEEHRQVLVLREIDGMAYEQIAEVLGVPRGTVESRLFRARAEFKSILKEYLP